MPCFFALSCRHAISKTRTNQYNLLHYICEEVLRSQYTEEDISQANCMHKSLITQQQNTNSIHNAKTFRLSSISIKRRCLKSSKPKGSFTSRSTILCPHLFQSLPIIFQRRFTMALIQSICQISEQTCRYDNSSTKSSLSNSSPKLSS